MTKIIKGAETAEDICLNLAKDILKLERAGITPTVMILRMGENRSDISYEQGAKRRCGKVGVTVKQVILPKNTPQEELIRQINVLNGDRSVHGILIMRPLPEQIDDEVVRFALAPDKDVDGITYHSLAGVMAGRKDAFSPCTAQACVEILDHLDVRSGRHRSGDGLRTGETCSAGGALSVGAE